MGYLKVGKDQPQGSVVRMTQKVQDLHAERVRHGLH